MAGAGGTVIVPWYATGFRHNDFETALNEVAAAALRYGATSYAVYRARDDRYKFQQFAAFAAYSDWERYWNGDEMTYFRATHSSWYQVPVLYGWWDRTAEGSVMTGPPTPPAGANGAGGNGHHGAPVGDVS